MQLPPTVDVDLTGPEMRRYWLARAAQHTQDRYAGLPLSKFPEDLRVYEHLLWAQAPEAVIELGSQFGGSALWFRDRLRALAGYGRVVDPLVVSIDSDLAAARDHIASVDRDHDGLVLLEGDVRSPTLAEHVAELLGGRRDCMVVEDTAHIYETTRAALEHFARFVPVGGFFVVEDGCVDVEPLRLSEDWPRGVLPALDDWLQTPAGSRFVVRRDLELYGVTCHPRGILQRKAS